MSAQHNLSTDRVRLAVILTPKPGVSEEAFREYWLNTHSEVFCSIAIAKRNLLKYEQFHVDSKLTAPLAAMLPDYTAPPYRGIAIMEAESMEKFYEIFQDEEYLRVVVPDEHKFLVRSAAIPLAGPIATIFGQ